MDAPPSGTPQGYGASDAPISTISSEYIVGSASFFDDPELDSLLENCFADCSNPQCLGVNDLFKEPAKFVSNQNELSNNVPPNAVQSECQVQPHVYNRSPSLILSYSPPASGKVLELEYSPPDQPLPAHVHVPTPFQPAQPVSAMPYFPPIPDLVSPSPFLHADVASSPVSSPNTPSHPQISMLPSQQPPPYPDLNNHQFYACPNVMCSQSHDPHHNFTFSIFDLEAKHINHLPADLFHDKSKLTAPILSMHHPYLLQNLPELALPKLEVPTSPFACIDGTSVSPTYMQSSFLSMADYSDSAALEISSASAPAAPATSNSSAYWAFTPPQSFSVPPSPTPSVNKKERSNEKIRRSPHGISQVAIKVKTKLLNLNDGFTWKKYGEKIIKNEKYTRSYFKCDEKDRRGCTMIKRVQKCSKDEGYVVYTYVGRHNHPS